MEKRIKQRKKRFWVFCLVLALAITQTGVGTVFATDYTLDDDSKLADGDGNLLSTGDIVYPGDTINFKTQGGGSYYNSFTITCYDNGEVLTSVSGTTQVTTSVTETVYRTAPDYPDSTKQEAFKGWEIQEILGSSGYLSSITFNAVFYNSSNITYNNTEGATNTNPATYYEGKEVITLADASKDNYNFDGWYYDADYAAGDFTNKVTAITTDMTGDISLTAKFSPKEFDITYHNVEGAVNTNPTSYTYGDGVASFAAASKTGYDFGGWYSDVELKTPITGISGTQSGNVDLYAKFIADEYAIEYELDGGTNGAGNPDKYTYGVGVTSFADASKTGYDFDGWYSDTGADSLTKVTKISPTQTGPVKLYAKYTAKDYIINYVVDGGKKGAGNPDKYTYGVGVTSFANASKTGYTFDGWYSDPGFTTKVTGISTTQTGTVTLYAKFTAKEYTISYELDGGTNGAGNPDKYTYGVGVKSFADASKDGYDFDGWYSDSDYTTKVTKISTTRSGNITLYAKFTYIKPGLKEGKGTIEVGDVIVGKTVKPIVKSSTNGTSDVTIEYKKKGEPDSSYTKLAPFDAGSYTARATFAKTDEYKSVTATDDFSISYLEAPAEPYNIEGTSGENSYYVSDVSIVPAKGYLISTTFNGTYTGQLQITESTAGISVYLKKAATGEMTSAIAVPEIKLDKTAPVILSGNAGDTVYADEIEVIVKDDNLSQVLVNNEQADISDGRAVLKLSSNQGEEKYELIVTDNAGNRTETTITVVAGWMKSMIIPIGEKVKLYTKYSYNLGAGKWKVSGDDTTYAGNVSFYVNSEGEYAFSKAD